MAKSYLLRFIRFEGTEPGGSMSSPVNTKFSTNDSSGTEVGHVELSITQDIIFCESDTHIDKIQHTYRVHKQLNSTFILSVYVYHSNSQQLGNQWQLV